MGIIQTKTSITKIPKILIKFYTCCTHKNIHPSIKCVIGETTIKNAPSYSLKIQRHRTQGSRDGGLQASLRDKAHIHTHVQFVLINA